MLSIFTESMDMIIRMMSNAALLLALTFIYGATNFNPKTNNIFRKIVLSLFIGAIAISLMTMPWYTEEGIFYDTRSILYGVTGFFFGWETTLLAALIGIIFRLSLGGLGMYAGSATILVSAGIGLAWKHIRKPLKFRHPHIEYLIFGFIVQVATLLAQFLMPLDVAINNISNVWFPFLILFPLASVIVMLGFDNQIKRLNASEEFKRQQLLLQASIDAPKSMEIFALDNHYNYLAFNKYHETSMLRYYNIHIETNTNYLEYIKDPDMLYRIRNFIDKALAGESFHRTVEVEDTKGKFLEELYSPIRNSENEVIGVTIFSQEITERKNYEESILYLSYHDLLTGLNNRRFYSEELARIDKLENYPLSIIMGDINGLKIMNDAFGHDAGDKLLRTVSSELKSVFAQYGDICRVGGDEFIILLKHTSKQEAQRLIDLAKVEIEENYIHGMKVSVSFGLATQIGDIDTNDIIRFAEDDMYKHKLFEVSSARNEAIQTIMNTLHFKNPREEYHSRRVSEYCVKIGKLLDMRDDEVALLKVIGHLHDIGKIGIDEAILNKPGKLNDEEFASIKRHTEIGYRILLSSREYREFAEDILSHHEHYDGSGYPQGLKGQDIPYRARIITIADAFDAMTSDRPYRKALTIQEALNEIEKHAGTQFDPVIAVKFVESMRKTKAE
ncbi:MAG: HD domain-containing phosphohydrolase [Candidatus Izemoplasmatales bacterium]